MHGNLPILMPLTLLVGSMVVALCGGVRKSTAYPLTLAVLSLAVVFAALGFEHAVTAGPIRHSLGGWIPPIGIEYVLDPLAGFMMLVVLFVATAVVAHSKGVVVRELPEREVAFYAVSLLLLTGFSGIILTNDLFNLYVFLEISSLSSYALVAAGERPSPVAAFRYLLVGTIGASFYLLGLGFLYLMCGSLNMADVARILPEIYHQPPVIVGLALIVVGVSVKMALFPLHSWLPDAYTFAPSATSALIAPLGTKIGAYVLLRVLFYVFDPAYVRDDLPVCEILKWLSLAAILFGSVMAMPQKEMKRMLAYSSVAQIGYIGLGIGLASAFGFIGAVLHVLNHAFMKGSLFLVAGNLRATVGHTQIPLFDHTLRKAMPWTMTAFTVSALSMIGIPPAAGFFSKWYLVLAGLEQENWMAVAVILSSSLLNAVYFFRVLERVYLRPAAGSAGGTAHHDSKHEPVIARKEVKGSMLIPTLVLSFGLLVLGLVNALIVNEIIRVMLPEGM
jgi:multicomponent Na+:H+ antiporter subunit D